MSHTKNCSCRLLVTENVASVDNWQWFPWFPKTKKHDLVSAPCVYLARYRCSNLLWNSDYSFQQLFVALSTRSIIFVTQKLPHKICSCKRGLRNDMLKIQNICSFFINSFIKSYMKLLYYYIIAYCFCLTNLIASN